MAIRPLDVVRDKQIQTPVLVVIHPRGAGAEFVGPEEAGLLRDVLEDAVVVAKQKALPERAHEQIVIAVVIEITDGEPIP